MCVCLTDADIAGIREAILPVARRPTLSIVHVSSREVVVYTGEIRGPLDADGNDIYLRKQGEQWIVTKNIGWLS